MRARFLFFLALLALVAPAAAEIAFEPQYPLWSDGTSKRRWLQLPPGTAIDAANPDAWDFPPGTKLWKEFSYAQRVETRTLERLADGTWRFAAYVWSADGTQAVPAPQEGIAALPVPDAPGGRYRIPSRADCLACHEGAPVPVLGFSAVQLSGELRKLAARGVLRNLPAALAAAPPGIAAPTPTARAALGYLHGNCGHCHNDDGPLASVDFSLAQRAGAPAQSAARAVRSVLSREPGMLVRKMHSPNPLTRMPPLGVSLPDREGIALIERWTRSLTADPKEPSHE